MGSEYGLFLYSMLGMLPLHLPYFPSFQFIVFKICYYYMQSAKQIVIEL